MWVGCGCEENLLVEGRENKEEKDFAFWRKKKSKSVCHDCESVCVWFCGGSRLGGNSYRKWNPLKKEVSLLWFECRCVRCYGRWFSKEAKLQRKWIKYSVCGKAEAERKTSNGSDAGKKIRILGQRGRGKPAKIMLIYNNFVFIEILWAVRSQWRKKKEEKPSRPSRKENLSGKVGDRS